MTTETLRAAIYVRVSKNRADDAAKPDRQIKSCALLGQAKGLQLVQHNHDEHGRPGIFLDDDVSAYQGKKERPAYQALLRLVEDGEVDVILSWHVDRLLRSLSEMTKFLESANRTGVSLESVQGGSIDLATPAGRMMFTILTAVAQAEVEIKAERHLLKNEQTRAAGGSTGGPVPFGWVLGEARSAVGSARVFVVDEPAQAMIRKATFNLIAGTATLTAVAREWNAAGLQTTFGKPWTHTGVKKVLLRPRNCGLVDHKGAILEGVKGDWEPLVSEAEWRRVTMILEGQRRPKAPRKHVLSSIIKCAECGGPLVAGKSHTKVRGVVYRGEVYKHGPGAGCGLTIRRAMAETKVKQAVRWTLSTRDLKELAPPSRDLSKALDLRMEIAKTEHRMKELEDLWSSGDFSTTRYKQQRKTLSEARETALERLAEYEQGNAFAGLLTALKPFDGRLQTAVEIGERFESLSLDHRKAIISALFPEILVLRGRGSDRVKIFDRNGEQFEFPDDYAPDDLGGPDGHGEVEEVA